MVEGSVMWFEQDLEWWRRLSLYGDAVSIARI
jgi:hypothetical protein